MEDIKQKLQELFESSNWSAEDRNWLLNYLEQNDSPDLQQIMQQQFTENVKTGEKLQSDSAKKLLERIRETINYTAAPVKIIRMNFWKRVTAAAVIILLAASAFFLFFNDKDKQEIVKTNPAGSDQNDVAPGGNKAVLTLSDGSTIMLDSVQNGTLSQQGNTKVLKLDDGQLAYTTSGAATEVLYNTVSTPRGGQYNLTLADGSKVWLNAASFLRFPATFSGNERKVELTGEAYFEVAKNASMPFKVNVAGKGEVDVLGTHFNINSYADETAINTTLLEGKVKVTPLINAELKTQNSQLLSPGQQAALSSNGQIAINKNVEVDEVVAWKNGVFNFTSENIEGIMRQISRWYDLDVAYQGPISKETFSGIVSRRSNVSQVLKIMEGAGVKFRIKGNNIIVIQ